MDGEDTSIKVSKTVRARLGVLADERGTTIRGLVEELAEATPTQDELKARGELARAYLRDHVGVDVTDDDVAAGDRLLKAMEARTAAAGGAAA
ncbi:hypothetical protein [Streptomyces sp. NPDC048639]|uniref:hypothetical protein n=1 Tax=Streptomyces sp. NPDC048639 TaxID=3365581 RepID=UPI00371BCAF3